MARQGGRVARGAPSRVVSTTAATWAPYRRTTPCSSTSRSLLLLPHRSPPHNRSPLRRLPQPRPFAVAHLLPFSPRTFPPSRSRRQRLVPQRRYRHHLLPMVRELDALPGRIHHLRPCGARRGHRRRRLYPFRMPLSPLYSGLLISSRLLQRSPPRASRPLLHHHLAAASSLRFSPRSSIKWSLPLAASSLLQDDASPSTICRR